LSDWQIHVGDCREILRTLPECSVQTCVTSPPYWGLRDYGVDGQLGLEQTPEEYVAEMVGVFRDVRRVLRDDGTLWLNLGDSYASKTKGSGGAGKSTLGPNGDLQNIGFQKFEPREFDPGLAGKQLVGIPWRVAFALQADGWYLRSDIIWSKPNPMPESVTDRPTKAHEYIFLLAKSERYFYDAEAIQERALQPAGDARLTGQIKAAVLGHTSSTSKLGANEGSPFRNRRSVWRVATSPYDGAHFATYPPKLIEPCILAGSREGDLVLDPFTGSGTTAQVALSYKRRFVGCELNPAYAELARKRLAENGQMRWAL